MKWDKKKFEDWEADGVSQDDWSDCYFLWVIYDGRYLTEEELEDINTNHKDIVGELTTER